MLNAAFNRSSAPREKIERLADRGVISGIILSPADEDQSHLALTWANASELGLSVLRLPRWRLIVDMHRAILRPP